MTDSDNKIDNEEVLLVYSLCTAMPFVLSAVHYHHFTCVIYIEDRSMLVIIVVSYLYFIVTIKWKLFCSPFLV